MKKTNLIPLALGIMIMSSCNKDIKDPVDPNSAEVVSVDRFSSEAGNLMVRNDANGLPAANAAINFDQSPFITSGLGANGETVQYYNFDIQPTAPAPIYVLFKEGEDTPIEGQLNIIDVIPGESGYNDFWQVNKVTVHKKYEANSFTSLQEIIDEGYEIEETETIVNCPVVPSGSTASKRYGGGSNALHSGWYKGKVVHYFTFEEKALSGSSVPTSPIYVTFNINPDQDGGGPASGFVTEEGNDQTHNVVATIPTNDAYSPLWSVNVYDNADFDAVSNLSTATSANILGTSVALVNCPVVSVQ